MARAREVTLPSSFSMPKFYSREIVHPVLFPTSIFYMTFRQAYQYNRTLSSGHLSPVKDYGVFFDNDSNAAFANGAKKEPAQSYLKQLWLKGPELGARAKSFSHMLSLKGSKENDPVGIARFVSMNHP